jgi:hypothetical protein
MSEPGPIRELNSPLARELAELELLLYDIESAFHQIMLWRGQFAPRLSMPREQKALSLALFRDAIVQFIGCFDKKAEFHLRKEDIYGEPGGLEFFQWLQDLRDAFAAHKFGRYRQSVAGVVVVGSERRIHFVHQIFTGHISKTDSDQILLFVGRAMEHLALRIRDEIIPRLLKSLESLSDEELNALPIAQNHPVSASEVRTSRTAFQRARTGKGPVTKRSTRSTKPPRE